MRTRKFFKMEGEEKEVLQNEGGRTDGCKPFFRQNGSKKTSLVSRISCQNLYNSSKCRNGFGKFFIL